MLRRLPRDTGSGETTPPIDSKTRRRYYRGRDHDRVPDWKQRAENG